MDPKKNCWTHFVEYVLLVSLCVDVVFKNLILAILAPFFWLESLCGSGDCLLSCRRVRWNEKY